MKWSKVSSKLREFQQINTKHPIYPVALWINKWYLKLESLLQLFNFKIHFCTDAYS